MAPAESQSETENFFTKLFQYAVKQACALIWLYITYPMHRFDAEMMTDIYAPMFDNTPRVVDDNEI